MEEQSLLEVRPATREFVLVSLFDVFFALVLAIVMFAGVFLAFLSFADLWQSFGIIALIIAIAVPLHVWGSFRRAKNTYICFLSDSVTYRYTEGRGKNRRVERGSLQYSDIQSVVVSRTASDWLFGTGSVSLLTSESKNFFFFRVNTPRIPHVKDPFVVRAEIDRVLASRSRPVSAEQSLQ